MAFNSVLSLFPAVGYKAIITDFPATKSGYLVSHIINFLTYSDSVEINRFFLDIESTGLVNDSVS